MENLIEISTKARGIFEFVLATSLLPDTSGTCLYAAITLQKMVDKFADGWSAEVCGGDGLGDGMYVDSVGIGHGHYWVQATHTSGQVFILDITADQFGEKDVVVLAQGSAIGKYVPGTQDVVNRHVEETLLNLAQTSESSPAEQCGSQVHSLR